MRPRGVQNRYFGRELVCDTMRKDVKSTETLDPQQVGHKSQHDCCWCLSADKQDKD